mmetsp:Transcript_26228/g.76937  ORF Transcript_26228/g.76937 Transcript_26228/m.76937 type:complete len:415 (-) Transcript_26228:544-1788(-)
MIEPHAQRRHPTPQPVAAFADRLPWRRDHPLTTAASTAASTQGPHAAATHHRALLRLLRLRVAHGLVHGKDHARRLRGRGDGVALHHRRLPDEGFVGVADVAVVHVHAIPGGALGVLLAELVEDVRGVQSGVLRHLARDHLEGLGVRADEQLLLAVDVAGGLAEVLRELHLDGPAPGDDGGVLHEAARGEDGVLQGPLCLVNELLSPAAQEDGVGARGAAAREKVEALAAHLLLLKEVARAEHLGDEAVAGGLHGPTARRRYALHVLLGHAAGAEDVAVREVLSGEVADGQAREDHLAACGDDEVELLVDDAPLRVHDGLVLRGLGDADFGVVLLRLELELHVEEDDLGALKALGLLLEARVGEGLLEGHALDEHGVLQTAALHLLDADHREGHVRVEGEHGVHDHLAEEGLVA